jgi:HipA-like protein
MSMYSKLSPENIIGVDVFLERFQTRTYVGKLKKEKDQFHFSYDPIYLKAKNILPLGPEFPLTQMEFFSQELFPSFADRLPDPDNPAYAEHCTAAKIIVTTADPIVLLATVGKKGPSSFIFEPIYKDTFGFSDCEKFREQLGLSLQDFAYLFDVSLSILQKIKAGTAEGKDILQHLEGYLNIPEALEFQLKKNAKYLHSEKIKNIWKWLELKQEEKETEKNVWKILSYQEVDYTQKCLKELSSCEWAKPLIKKINDMGLVPQCMPILFEIRFAYALYKTGLKIEHEYKAGVRKSDVDFLAHDKNDAKWLIELTSLDESEEVKKNTVSYGNFSLFSSTTSSNDTTNKEEVMGLIRAQRAILSKVAKIEKDGKVSPTKFPEPKPGEYNIIIIDMRGFVIGGSDRGDYINILYGSAGFITSEDVEECGRFWINSETKEKISMLGIFNSDHPDERAKYLQERIHGVGFISESHYANGEISTKLELFPNRKFYNNSNKADLENLWPLKKDSRRI